LEEALDLSSDRILNDDIYIYIYIYIYSVYCPKSVFCFYLKGSVQVVCEVALGHQARPQSLCLFTNKTQHRKTKYEGTKNIFTKFSEVYFESSLPPYNKK